MIGASLAAVEEKPDRLVLEDFESAEVGEAPSTWKARAFGDEGVVPYVVEEEDGNRFLRAEATGENVMLYKEIRWSAIDYPYISWRWRIRAVPEGADARYEDTADSAAGLYLSYRRKLGLVPETVKFVWSAQLRTGSFFRRSGIGQAWTVVAGTGPANEKQWHRVYYRVPDVYRETFGNREVSRPLGVGVLSDANSTQSFAAADYDDLVVLRSLPPGATLGALSHPLELGH